MAAVVKTEKLCKTYKIGLVQLPVLRDVDLEIEQGLSRQPIILSNVDLPEPLGPIMAIYWPASIFRLALRSAGN